MTAHVFTAPDFNGHSPLSWYQAAAEQPGFIRDPAQEQAIRMLDELWSELMMFKRKRNRFMDAACARRAPRKGCISTAASGGARAS